MTDLIRIGDTVTWRKKVDRGHIPIGIGSCRIIEFGTSTEGQPAALIELPRPFQEDDGSPMRVGARIEDLHRKE